LHLQDYDESVYLHEDAQLENQIVDVPGLHIIATDYNPRAIENSRKNAVAAGVC
jgi:putative N6-adenine-specific DNA methylase